jgi:predicted  nucleic acid-binding Zn-ribbon protein
MDGLFKELKSVKQKREQIGKNISELYTKIRKIRRKSGNTNQAKRNIRKIANSISLKEENVRLEEELLAVRDQERQLTALNSQLTSEIVEAKSQVVEVPVSLVKKEQEIDELVNADFVPQGLDSNFKQDSVFIWQNIYFKLWVLFLILAEWIIRKFKELR